MPGPKRLNLPIYFNLSTCLLRLQQAKKTITMKKAVQPLTAATSKIDLFDTQAQLSPAAQRMVKGGDGGDDDDTSNIIVEDVIEH